jgi:hypothetical protein
MAITQNATYANCGRHRPASPRPVPSSSNEHLAAGSEMPHGGVKGSGFGKDMSMYPLEER